MSMSERNGGAFDAPVYKREQRKASRAVHQEDVRAENERLRAALKEITGAFVMMNATCSYVSP